MTVILEESGTYTVEEAAAALRMHVDTVRKRVRRGEIPAFKPGRRLVFMGADLLAYLEQQQCRSSDKGARTGTRNGTRATEAELYAAALGLETSAKRPQLRLVGKKRRDERRR